MSEAKASPWTSPNPPAMSTSPRGTSGRMACTAEIPMEAAISVSTGRDGSSITAVAASARVRE